MNTSDKSKKYEFSIKNPDDSDTNFQAAHMINKMKKVKNNRKIKNNYKNIEGFNVLENKMKVSGKKKEKKTTVENFNANDNYVDNKVIEGLDNCTEEDLKDRDNKDCYEGHDKIDGDAKQIKWKEKFIDGVNDAYDNSTIINNTISDNLADLFSNGTATKNDKLLIREYFASLFAGLISIPVSFNWYFVMFFSDYDSLYHLKVDELKEKASKEDSSLLKMLLWFFEFAIFFPETLDNFFTKVIPDNTKWLNGKVKFILLHIIVFFIIKDSIVNMKDLLISLLTDVSGSAIISLMFFVVFVIFFMSLFKYDIPTVISFVSSPFTFLILHVLIRFIFIMILSVPTGGFMSMIYLFAYSIFALVIYARNNLSDTIKNVIIHSNESGAFKVNETCYDDDIWTLLFKAFVNIVGLLKTNIYYILFIAIIIFYSLKFSKELSDSNAFIPGLSLKSSFVYFNCFLLLILMSFIYLNSSSTNFNIKEII